MSSEDQAAQWRNGAEKALKAAKNLCDAGDYELALFACHLAVEKALKAKSILSTSAAPPKSHNLVQLANICGWNVSQEEKLQLQELSSFSEFARYGDESWVDAEATLENVRRWIDVATVFLASLHI